MTRRLLIRPGGIGDCILSIPALEAARTDFTEVWVPRSVCPLLTFADRVRALPDTGLDLFGIPEVDPPTALLEALASFDSIYSWYGAQRADFRNAARHLPIHFFPALPDPAGQEHAADFFARQTGATVPAVPRLTVQPSNVAANKIVIHPYSGSPRKNWPLDSFLAVARKLERAGESVLWCVSADQDLPKGLPALRRESLQTLAQDLAGARLYIGNDSGITHLAAACGVPVVAVFLVSDPAVWAPRGPCVQIVTQPEVDSPPDELVLAAARSILLQSHP